MSGSMFIVLETLGIKFFSRKIEFYSLKINKLPQILLKVQTSVIFTLTERIFTKIKLNLKSVLTII